MNLPVVVLAGGLATRLRPVTEKIPKSLIDINGKPFVLHQLALFKKHQISRVHFCLGFLGEMVEEVVRNSPFALGMQLTFSYDGEKLLGTGGAIKKAFPYLAADFLVTYGDSYLEVSYNDIEAFYQKRQDQGSAVMVIYKNLGQFDKSNVVFENDSLFYSKTKSDAKMAYIDYGISVVNKDKFFKYEENTPFDLSEVYEQLSLDHRLIGYAVHNRFYEIGSFSGIQELSEHLKE